MSCSFRLISGLLLKDLLKRVTQSTTATVLPALKRINRARGFLSSSLLGTVSAKTLTVSNDRTREHLDFETEIKRATEEGEKYLSQLMRMLRTLILQTSLEYQECLLNQIELTRTSTRVGPLGAHWDKLTSYRVHGKELKEELNKYQLLANSIAKLVDQQVSSSLVTTGSDINLNHLNLELEKLQKLCKEQLREIFKYEAQLLLVNRNSILNTRVPNS